LLFHPGEDRARRDYYPEQVDVKDFASIFERLIGQVEVVVDSGIVHQHVDRAKAIRDPARDFRHLRLISDVGADGHPASSASGDFRFDLSRLVVAEVGDHYRSAFTREAQRILPPDTLSAAGDNRRLALQSHFADASVTVDGSP